MDRRGTAIVTGASRGIGRAIAVRLAEDGYNIAFCYRSSADAAKQTEVEIRENGARAFHAQCDVADLGAVQTFVEKAEAELGETAVLVNCAGIVKDSPLVIMPPQDWSSVIDTNLTGTFNLCRTVAFGFMKRKSGVIVNISSVSGVYGNPTQANYSASKSGIHGMSKAIAKEVAGYGVRVNVVAPGFIDTDMTAGISEKQVNALIQRIPMKSVGKPEDVSELVSFLVSDKAAYITGQVIQVDGGISF
ncbi:3-oxoacyl-[acyl-carrier-protein] reductase [Nocardia brasiliensis]|uniref:3-oxoacyl-[acyl-carrier-protein] reductase n=1 Tax=Nocardia brasiliensis TaxID=37326 RepID=UPI0037A7F579